MKLHSKPHSRRTTQSQVVSRVALIAVGVLVLGLLVPHLFSLVSRVVMSPIHAVNSWIQFSDARLPMFIRDRTELMTRITELEQEVAIAAGTDLTERRLFEENQWLRQLLGVQGEDRIAAAVIARPGQLPYDYLQIDKGRAAGVEIGVPVYVGRDNVIGVVVDTAEGYSFVQLFTTPGFSATAFISGANVMATIDGHGGGIARVRVPQGVPLAVGNLVHLPSLSPGVFGRIAYLENEPSQPEQFGYIALPQPITSLHYVAVGTRVIAPVELPVIEDRVLQLVAESLRLDMSQLNLASTTIISTSTATTTTP